VNLSDLLEKLYTGV